jgi:atypical dual specificity phosphatase
MSLPPNFSFTWKALVAGSAHPGGGRQLAQTLESLQSHGFGAIVSLTEDALDYAMIREFGFDYLHLPVEDFTAPTPAQVDRAMEFMQQQTMQQRAVLVHCQAGIGRTGTLLACFLVTQGIDPAQAILDVRRRRPGSLEVYTQEYAVHQFARRWQESKDQQDQG